MSNTTGIAPFNLGEKGRLVLPIAVRRAAQIADGADLVARAEGEGRVVIETRDAISLRVWANAPTPTGVNTVELVREMRNEDNEISEENLVRRGKKSSSKKTEEAGALLLKSLGY